MAQLIRTIHKPKILLEDIEPLAYSETGDYGTGDYTGLESINRDIDFSKRTGLKNFFLNINGMMVNPDKVEKCVIDVSDFYPTITLRFQQDLEEVINLGLPKDGDLISVFYRSLFDELKPLRVDFVITDVISETDNFFVLFGVINIQELFKDSSYYKEETSLNTLIDLSKVLNLGFATNETSTKDKQKWVCANEPYDVFIRDMKKHIWKDEKTFFECFIDNFYVLNFVNVFEQLDMSKDKSIGIGLNKIRNFVEYAFDSITKVKDESISYIYPTILHNYRENLERNHQIVDLKILNTSSRISLEEGYQKVSHFFDYTLEEKVEIVSETLTSNGMEKGFASLKGKINNRNWRRNTRHSWNGVSYSLPDGNTHPFYNQAMVQNEYNLKEIDKFTIEVTLNDINFNVHRFMVIPVLWYEYGDIAKIKRLFEPEDRNERLIDNDLGVTVPYVLNDFISGFYVVKGYRYEFIGSLLDQPDTQVVQHKLILTRLELPKNVNITSDITVMSNFNYDVGDDLEV